jgi:hypothetical protein
LHFKPTTDGLLTDGPLSQPTRKGLPDTYQVSTPININVMEQELRAHPDQVFVSKLLDGLRFGFDTGIQQLPDASFICRNLQSAQKQPEVVTNLLERELEKGYIIGPFDKPPFDIYRINPLGLAEHKYSKKQRLIVDLSAPHNRSDHPSLNELIDKDDFSVSYVTIDHAVSIIKLCGPGALLTKCDIVDAFKILPLRRDLWRFHGVQWDNKFYFFVRLCFGSRSSPKIFTMLSEAIYFIATHNYGMKHLLFLLDDFLSVDYPRASPRVSLSIFTTVFGRLNIPLHPDKTLGPDTTMVFLGITLDSITRQAFLPPDKVRRILGIVNELCSRRSITKRELLSLLGHLNFASRVVVPGRSFVSYLLSLASSVRELYHHVRLTKNCLSDLHMWRVFLENWNGISFFYDDDVTDAANYHLFTDASGALGYAGYFQGKWFALRWPRDLPELGTDDVSIAFMELAPIVTCAVLWGEAWARKRILFHCDNMATVAIINKGRSRSPLIMKLMRRLTLCAATGNYIVHAKHIPGKDNTLTDCLSRFQIAKFRRLAPQADANPTAAPALHDLYRI